MKRPKLVLLEGYKTQTDLKKSKALTWLIIILILLLTASLLMELPYVQ